MKSKSIVCLVVLMGAIAFMSGKAMSDDKNGDGAKQPTAAEMQEMMEKCMAAGRPGEQHKWLEPLVGKWNVTTKCWMGGPSSPPSVTKGSSESRWVLDGRFIEDQFKGTMQFPNAKGEMEDMPFEGKGLTGYDNTRKMFVGTWADSMGTCILTMKGSSPDGKTFTYYGEMDEPTMGVVGRLVKYVTKVVDKNKHTFEMYDLHAGDNYKVMEITYTRQ